MRLDDRQSSGHGDFVNKAVESSVPPPLGLKTLLLPFLPCFQNKAKMGEAHKERDTKAQNVPHTRRYKMEDLAKGF